MERCRAPPPATHRTCSPGWRARAPGGCCSSATSTPWSRTSATSRSRRDGDQLVGSGAVDMKGGVVLALGVLRALAARPDAFAEVALLLVCDEEWRTAPFAQAERFAGWDACLCFEAGELTPDGDEGVVVRRKAAGTVRVERAGRSAHSGSAPERGRNALLALAAAAQAVAGARPDGPDRLTAVPTVLHSGDAFNVVPGARRAGLRPARGRRGRDRAACSRRSRASTTASRSSRSSSGVAGHALRGGRRRRCSRGRARPSGGRSSGRPRGGASDASHFAATIPSRSTGSARAAARRTTRASTCSRRRWPARRGRAGGDGRRARGRRDATRRDEAGRRRQAPASGGPGSAGTASASSSRGRRSTISSVSALSARREPRHAALLHVHARAREVVARPA